MLDAPFVGMWLCGYVLSNSTLDADGPQVASWTRNHDHMGQTKSDRHYNKSKINYFTLFACCENPCKRLERRNKPPLE